MGAHQAPKKSLAFSTAWKAQRRKWLEDFVDFFRQHKVKITDSLHAVSIQVDDHFVPHVGPFRMMVHRFGHQRDARHVAESSDEIIAGKISASESFFAGMSHSSRIGWRSLQLLCGASSAPATIPASPPRAANCVSARSGSSLNARGNSIIVRVSFEAKMRVIRARKLKVENDVKKKIRAIQYGVGPIGASIVRLMREKQAIEIIGAIDTDPAKVGRDLGEVVGAKDAPWGVIVSAEAKEVLEQNADVVIHSTSSSLAKVMDQLLVCLEAESCIVSTCEELSYPFRTHPELAAKLDAAAKDSGVSLVGTGVNPGFIMDKLVVTLAAVSQRIEHVKALRVVDASKRRLPLQKKIGAGMTVEEFRGQVAAGVIKHVGLPESVSMVADSLNLPVEQITETIEPKIATERVQTEYLTVEAGQAAGVHQIARG